MGQNIIYRKSSELPVLYDYENVQDGIGYRLLYGCRVEDSVGSSYILTSSSSLASYPSGYTTVVAGSPVATVDFDYAANKYPRTVKGTAYCQIGMYNQSGSNGYTIQIKKWDGSTETNISSKITSATISGISDVVSVKIPLTETIILPGENIRATVEYIKSANSEGIWGHDPTNQDQGSLQASNASTQMIIHMPYKVDK